MPRAVRLLLQCLFFLVPWFLRHRLLRAVFGYQFAPTSRIGLAIVDVGKLHMGPGCRIDHFSVIFGLDRMEMGEESLIGKFNWISGLRAGQTSFFHDQPERSSALVMGRHSAIVNRHVIDCSDTFEIGEFSTLAGWYSQIVTHGIDLMANRERCAPVKIGRYVYVGTHVVLLKGAIVPDFSAVGAGAVYRLTDAAPFGLFAGVPAQRIGELKKEAAYFHRLKGAVD
jgi:acetyltransferase-like isoleucine patch superfamily enzyme